jgi:hypothetical protein
MTDNVSEPRSRRALLAAAAGGAAALAASAALPLTAMADTGGNVVLGHNEGAANVNTADAPTGITNSTADSNAFEAKAAGTGFGLLGTSAGGAGIVGWSVTDPNLPPANGAYTGIYGFSPAGPDVDTVGVGVVGESDDWGVVGTGSVGVVGFGAYGVIGQSQVTGGAGVLAVGVNPNDLALQVSGKVKFSRSGRSNISAGTSSRLIYLAGVTSSSKVFALLHSNRGGRYVRAVVPATGKFRIYLNASVSSTTSVAWFVLD